MKRWVVVVVGILAGLGTAASADARGGSGQTGIHRSATS